MTQDADVPQPIAVAYGAHPSQYFEVHRPAAVGPHPVVVLIHGGFWRLPWDRTLMRPLAQDLVGRGYAAVNVEYRRLGEDGGGWPGTCMDVAAALRRLGESAGRPGAVVDDAAAEDGLPSRPGAVVDDAAAGDGLPEGLGSSLDLDSVALVGHSAGGHLALWAAHHTDLDVRLVVSQAGVADLRAAVRDRLDEGNGKPPAALEFMGIPAAEAAAASETGAAEDVAGPETDSASAVGAADLAYRLASPIELLPLGPDVRQLVLHGDVDNRVPRQQSLDYAQTAQLAGDDVRLAGFTGMGHFELIDPAHESWQLTLAELAALPRPPR